MPTLGQIIREIQREAAALPTDALRHEIEINLEVQDAAIRPVLRHPARRPDGGRPDHREQHGHGLGPDNRPVRPGADYPARGPSHGRRHQSQLARTNAGPGGRPIPPGPAGAQGKAPYHASNLSERKLRHA